MTHTGRAARIAPALLGAALAAGCGEDTSAPAPNQFPITEITGGPAESSRVASSVTFFFRGSDYDGTVREFDWILDTYPRWVVDRDQITLRQPEPSDPGWTRVEASQITLTVPADTLLDDPQAPTGNLEFERWSTFYVRAIDNDGGFDASPATVTFQAFTQAPVLEILSPARVGDTATLPRNFVMNWDGFDAVGSGEPYQDPYQVRWVLLPATLDVLGDPIGFPQTLYDLPEATWSAWSNWAAADSSGRSRAFLNVVPPGPNIGTFVFAVQGRDEAGAITPQFDRDTPEKNNYATLFVDGERRVGPRLTVRAQQDSLSSWFFDGTEAPPYSVPTALDTVTMLWDPPVASHYGARTGETRYGWDILNVEDDEEWTAWSSSVRFAGPRFVGGSGGEFFVQARDELGQLTTGRIDFQPVSRR